MSPIGIALLGALLSSTAAAPPITFTKFDQNHSALTPISTRHLSAL